jgi:septal ring factor EnvC (AmiA/AmiB activator)
MSASQLYGAKVWAPFGAKGFADDFGQYADKTPDLKAHLAEIAQLEEQMVDVEADQRERAQKAGEVKLRLDDGRQELETHRSNLADLQSSIREGEVAVKELQAEFDSLTSDGWFSRGPKTADLAEIEKRLAWLKQRVSMLAYDYDADQMARRATPW